MSNHVDNRTGRVGDTRRQARAAGDNAPQSQASPMTKQELLDALLVERWSTPIRDDRPLPLPMPFLIPRERATEEEIAALVEELYPLRIVETCAYAACGEAAEQQVDGWAFCRVHARRHAEEVAS